MRKVLITLSTIAFVMTGFAMEPTFAASKCDPVANAAACKSAVHKKAPKKAAPTVVKKKKKKTS